MTYSIQDLDDTPWLQLCHAYGRATDTPRHIRALADGKQAARTAAIAHLSGTIMHQGTPWTATAPTALFVAALLRDPNLQLRPRDRAALVSFVGNVGSVILYSPWSIEECEQRAAKTAELPEDPADDEIFWEDVETGDGMYARALVACARSASTLLDAVRPELDSEEKQVRVQAACAVGRIASGLILTKGVPRGVIDDIETLLLDKARSASSTVERCAILLALREVGAEPREFVDDESMAVSVCAALAIESDESATGKLIAALEDAEHLHC